LSLNSESAGVGWQTFLTVSKQLPDMSDQKGNAVETRIPPQHTGPFSSELVESEE
jgi:hypothetical protein